MIGILQTKCMPCKESAAIDASQEPESSAGRAALAPIQIYPPSRRGGARARTLLSAHPSARISNQPPSSGFSNSAPPSTTASSLFDAHPADIVGILFGSETVVLSGFAAEPMPGTWLRPALRFVSADMSVDAGLREQIKQRTRTLRLLTGSTWAVGLLGLVFLGFLLGTYVRPDSTPPVADLNWSVLRIEQQGVVVQFENTVFTVAPGQALPNGDVLQTVLPDRFAYTTERSTVVLQPLAPQTSSGQAGTRPPQARP